MDPIDVLIHLLNFLAPALGVALLLALFARLFVRNRASTRSLWTQTGVNFVACALALGLGLWFFGRDGKMASYAALVVFAATSQWSGGRSWR